MGLCSAGRGREVSRLDLNPRFGVFIVGFGVNPGVDRNTFEREASIHGASFVSDISLIFEVVVDDGFLLDATHDLDCVASGTFVRSMI